MSSRPVPDSHLIDKLSPYFHEIETSCPYGLPFRAVYRVAAFNRIPGEIMGALLAAGYRRNGNNVYAMRCPDCRGCRPIRLVPRHFVPNRDQRRNLHRNLDVTLELGPLVPDHEKITLLQKFFDQRFPNRHNSASDYYAGFFLNSSEFSLEIKHLLNGRLLGVSIVDVGTDWLNAVYFFFDPAEARRGPGTFNILHLINLCREHDLKHLYLGYSIAEVQAMRYKTSFLPHQILTDGTWLNITSTGRTAPRNAL